MIETTVLVAVIMGLVEVVKKTNRINEAYLPLVAIIIGIVMNTLANGVTVQNGLEGIVAALISCGLYDLGKNPARAIYGAIKK